MGVTATRRCSEWRKGILFKSMVGRVIKVWKARRGKTISRRKLKTVFLRGNTASKEKEKEMRRKGRDWGYHVIDWDGILQRRGLSSWGKSNNPPLERPESKLAWWEITTPRRVGLSTPKQPPPKKTKPPPPHPKPKNPPPQPKPQKPPNPLHLSAASDEQYNLLDQQRGNGWASLVGLDPPRP